MCATPMMLQDKVNAQAKQWLHSFDENSDAKVI